MYNADGISGCHGNENYCLNCLLVLNQYTTDGFNLDTAKYVYFIYDWQLSELPVTCYFKCSSLYTHSTLLKYIGAINLF